MHVDDDRKSGSTIIPPPLAESSGAAPVSSVDDYDYDDEDLQQLIKLMSKQGMIQKLQAMMQLGNSGGQNSSSSSS